MWNDVLMSTASIVWLVGKHRTTTTNATHATATVPIGVDHRPRANGPGMSFVRPEVILRKMGVAYEV